MQNRTPGHTLSPGAHWEGSWKGQAKLGGTAGKRTHFYFPGSAREKLFFHITLVLDAKTLTLMNSSVGMEENLLNYLSILDSF